MMSMFELLAIDEEDHKRRLGKTLKQRQQETGRTLALDGKAWRTLRAAVLTEQPLCAHCLTTTDMPVPATDVDHIDNNPSNNARDNLVGLCHECHSRKTQADMGHHVTYGCNANGWPLDPDHPWNKSPATDDDKPPGKSRFLPNSKP